MYSLITRLLTQWCVCVRATYDPGAHLKSTCKTAANSQETMPHTPIVHAAQTHADWPGAAHAECLLSHAEATVDSGSQRGQG